MPNNRDNDDDKKSKTTTKDPWAEFSDLDDIIGYKPKNLPASQEKKGDISEPSKAKPEATPTADLPRASGERTRSRLSGMSTSDELRGYMDRLAGLEGEDEIDDAEAARRAGVTPQGQPVNAPGAVEPQEPNTLPVPRVTPENLPAVINTAVAVPDIEWHQISNLPGYLRNAVRSLGRKEMAKRTRTPLEDILTIAYMRPPNMDPNRPDTEGRPNTQAELTQVASYLLQNGEEFGVPPTEHGRDIPGYDAEVREYVLNGIRFHVVRDFIDGNLVGHYIYAWPESDTRNVNNRNDDGNPRIGGGGNAPRIGRGPRFLPRESTMKKSTPLTEAQEHKMLLAEQYQSRMWTLDLILEQILRESTLSRMIGKSPGGQPLVRWMHARHLLSNEANYQSHDFEERMMWKEFKNHPDNFLILVGTEGAAGIKPNEADIKTGYERAAKQGKTYNPATDTTLRYQIVAFRGNQMVDPELLRDPKEVERDRDPTVMRARGGMIDRPDPRNPNNIFDRIREQIGNITEVLIARGAVEREKLEKRKPEEEMPADPYTEKAKMLQKLRPVLKKLGFQALSIVSNRIRRFNDGGNYEKAAETAQIGKEIKDFLAQVDTTGALDVNRGKLGKVINDAIATAFGGDPKEAAMRMRSMKTAELGPFLDAVRANLLKVHRYYN